MDFEIFILDNLDSQEIYNGRCTLRPRVTREIEFVQYFEKKK